MEIVLAMLLLFGGFALGSATADKHDDFESSSMAVSPTQDMRKCISDKSGIYRDLTVPYSDWNESQVFEADTCEGKCPDE